jgi:double-stranded uracil-DNA glycosylase
MLEPTEYRELLEHCLGLTDLCKTYSGSDQEVGTRGFDVGQLQETLAKNAPAWIGFNGKKSASVALGRPVDYGEQPERLETTSVFVLPSTSGAARGFWDPGYWHEFASRIRES